MLYRKTETTIACGMY